MTTGKINDSRSYYCSMKFRFLKIDLESKTTYNCHAAKPHPVDFDWLSKSTGQLFNTPVNVSERHMMLKNIRNSSCEQNCWAAEDVGGISPRLQQHGYEQTHFAVNTQPEIIDLTIGSNCNLTCSYCCKEFSSSWRQDIAVNGSYNIASADGRFDLDTKDRVLMKISQKELKSTLHYQTLLNEIELAAPGLKRLVVTGGEPFLDNGLIETLAKMPFAADTKIQIYTGLGVSKSRFERILENLQKFQNLQLIVSAECTERFHEFNRYGSSWQDFNSKIELLNDNKINFRFQATLSNLTIFGFANFANYFKDKNITVSFAHHPSMMAPYVLDETSKQYIIEQAKSLSTEMQNLVAQSLITEPSEQQRQDLKQFFKEFVRRRNLDASIYPDHFLHWIDYVV